MSATITEPRMFKLANDACFPGRPIAVLLMVAWSASAAAPAAAQRTTTGQLGASIAVQYDCALLLSNPSTAMVYGQPCNSAGTHLSPTINMTSAAIAGASVLSGPGGVAGGLGGTPGVGGLSTASPTPSNSGVNDSGGGSSGAGNPAGGDGAQNGLALQPTAGGAVTGQAQQQDVSQQPDGGSVTTLHY